MPTPHSRVHWTIPIALFAAAALLTWLVFAFVLPSSPSSPFFPSSHSISENATPTVRSSSSPSSPPPSVERSHGHEGEEEMGNFQTKLPRSSYSAQTAQTEKLPEILSFKILKTFHHDPKAFTQGLFYSSERNGTFYESTGMWGQSGVREVDVNTGKVRRLVSNLPTTFGEGLAEAGGRLFQLTWQTKDVNVFEKKTLKYLGKKKHPMGDGWGLTTATSENGSILIGSDGSSSLFFLNATTLKLLRRVTVSDGGRPITQLNELEFIDGFIWANVWQTNCIAKIRPEDGKIAAWLYAPQLRLQLLSAYNSTVTAEMDVLNGIAWDATNSRFFVTGKYWPAIFQLKLTTVKRPTREQLQQVQSSCWNKPF